MSAITPDQEAWVWGLAYVCQWRKMEPQRRARFERQLETFAAEARDPVSTAAARSALVAIRNLQRAERRSEPRRSEPGQGFAGGTDPALLDRHRHRLAVPD